MEGADPIGLLLCVKLFHCSYHTQQVFTGPGAVIQLAGSCWLTGKPMQIMPCFNDLSHCEHAGALGVAFCDCGVAVLALFIRLSLGKAFNNTDTVTDMFEHL